MSAGLYVWISACKYTVKHVHTHTRSPSSPSSGRVTRSWTPSDGLIRDWFTGTHIHPLILSVCVCVRLCLCVYFQRSVTMCVWCALVLWPGQATCGGFGAGRRCVGKEEGGGEKKIGMKKAVQNVICSFLLLITVTLQETFSALSLCASNSFWHLLVSESHNWQVGQNK